MGEDGVDDALGLIDKSAVEGFAHAQSVLGFCYGSGVGMKMNRGKSMVYHQFAADGGNAQSKLALAYSYFRQTVSLGSRISDFSFLDFFFSHDKYQIWL